MDVEERKAPPEQLPETHSIEAANAQCVEPDAPVIEASENPVATTKEELPEQSGPELSEAQRMLLGGWDDEEDEPTPESESTGLVTNFVKFVWVEPEFLL